jgi:hypothetical protein
MNKQKRRRLFDERPEHRAARAHRGEDQDPVQADPESSTLWDTDQHSRARGPFGTGPDPGEADD